MIIHKSHSKKSLIELFEDLNCPLDFPVHTKRDAVEQIKSMIKPHLNINQDNNYNINNISDLLCYLEKQNNHEKISMEDKNNVMLKCKKIIKYATSGYNFDATDYQTRQQLYNDIIFISPYGFIPSVRRACKLYNEDINRIEHVNPIIPKKIQNELNEKRKIKRNYFYNFKVEKGKFIVSFD